MGTPVKSGYFTDISASGVKTVADRDSLDMLLIITSTGDELFSNIMNGLE